MRPKPRTRPDIPSDQLRRPLRPAVFDRNKPGSDTSGSVAREQDPTAVRRPTQHVFFSRTLNERCLAAAVGGEHKNISIIRVFPGWEIVGKVFSVGRDVSLGPAPVECLECSDGAVSNGDKNDLTCPVFPAQNREDLFPIRRPADGLEIGDFFITEEHPGVGRLPTPSRTATTRRS